MNSTGGRADDRDTRRTNVPLGTIGDGNHPFLGSEEGNFLIVIVTRQSVDDQRGWGDPDPHGTATNSREQLVVVPSTSPEPNPPEVERQAGKQDEVDVIRSTFGSRGVWLEEPESMDFERPAELVNRQGAFPVRGPSREELDTEVEFEERREIDLVDEREVGEHRSSGP